jgi:hypothetical protein
MTISDESCKQDSLLVRIPTGLSADDKRQDGNGVERW